MKAEMRVCHGCFSEKERELNGFIDSSGKIEVCDCCGSKNNKIISLRELFDFFEELLNSFQRSEDGKPLYLKIQEEWKFFASEEIAQTILTCIIQNVNSSIDRFNDKVEYTEDIVTNFSYWETLKDNIKWKRRFLQELGILQDELGWDGFFNTQYELDDSVFTYRARVHHESGMPEYSVEEMKCPEPKRTRGGRANPSGIPYLYLSDNPETVLFEVRASYLDEVSVGKFKLAEGIGKVRIVDFTEQSPLFQPNSVNETIKAKNLRERISRDLSKPMRRYDTEIEYVPTQFICEFIKVFTGASGIRFSSSLHSHGKNIVIFDENIMTCVEVSLQKVDALSISASDYEQHS